MADQLSINIQVQGGDAALSALRQVRQAQQDAAQAIGQTASAQQGASQAWTAAGAAAEQTARQVTQASASVQEHGRAWLSLGGVLGGMPGPLNEVGRAFGAVHISLTETQAATIAVGGAFTAVGTLMAGAFQGALGQAMEFERVMGSVRATLPTTEIQQFGDQLGQLALKLGRDTVFSASEAAEGIQNLARQGVSTQDILNGVAVAATNMAAAMGTTPKEAALALGAALREFHLQASDANMVADLFSQAVHVAGLSADGLRTALGYVGPIIRSLGGDLHDATTGIELLARSGISAGRAGTQLAQVYEDVVNPRTAKAADEMQRLGLITADGGNRFVDASGKVRPFVEVAQILGETLSRLTPAEAAHSDQIIFSRRAMEAAMVITSQYATGGLQQLIDAQHVARDAASAMAERLDNLWGSMKQLSSSAQTLAVEIGGSLEPAIRPAVETVKNFVDTLSGLPPQTIQTVAAVGAVEAAVLTVGGAITTATVAVGLFGPELAVVAAAAAGVVAPITAIGVASGVLVAAWVNDWGNIREAVGATQATIEPFWADFTSEADKGAAFFTQKAKEIQDAWQQIQAAQSTPNAPGAQPDKAVFEDQLAPIGAAIDSFLSRGMTQWGDAAHRVGDAIGGGIHQGIIDGLPQPNDPVTSAELTKTLDGLAEQLEMHAPVIADGYRNAIRDAITTGGLTADMSRQLATALAADLSTELGETVSPAAALALVGRLVSSVTAEQPGKQIVDVISSGVADGGGTLAVAVERLLDDAKGSYTKAIKEAIDEGNQAAAAELLKEQDQIKVVDQALAGLSASRRAEILEIQNQQGVQDALDHVYQSGLITQQQYQNALDGTAESHKKVVSALQEHKAQLQELLQSTNAAQVAEGLRIQGLDQLVEKEAKLVPEIQAQIIAYVNSGDAMSAATLIANRLGVGLDTVLEAARGNAEAMGLLEVATGKTSAAHQSATSAAREHAAALKDLKTSTDATEVAAGLYADQLTKVNNQALAGMDLATRAVVQATVNAHDEFSATQQMADYYGLAVDTVRQALEGQIAAENALTEAIKRKRAEEVAAAAAAGTVAGPLPPNSGRISVTSVGGAAGLPRGLTYLSEANPRMLPDDSAYYTGSTLGGSLSQGVATGLAQGSGLVTQAATDVVTGAVDAMQTAIEAHSPSLLTARVIGRPLAEGIGVGFQDGLSSLGDTLTAGIQQVIDQAGSGAETALTDSLAQLIPPLRAAGDQLASVATLVDFHGPYTADQSFGQSRPETMAFLENYYNNGPGAAAAPDLSLRQLITNQSLSPTFGGPRGPISGYERAAQEVYAQAEQTFKTTGHDPLQTMSPGGFQDAVATQLFVEAMTQGGSQPSGGIGASGQGQGGGGGAGGGSVGSSGSGLAEVPVYMPSIGGALQSILTRESGDPLAIARTELTLQQNSIKAGAKALADGVSYAALAWSNIQQQSASFGSQFAAYQVKTLESAAQVNNAVGSVAGSYIQTVTGASGGAASGPLSAQNGATGPSAFNTLVSNITGQVGTLGSTFGSTAGVVADQMNTVGRYTEAIQAAQLEQNDATNEVKRLQSLLDSYGGHLENAGDVISALAAAQARAAAAANHLASVQTDVANKTVVGTAVGPTANPIDINNANNPNAFKPSGTPITGPVGQAGGQVAPSQITTDANGNPGVWYDGFFYPTSQYPVSTAGGAAPVAPVAPTGVPLGPDGGSPNSQVVPVTAPAVSDVVATAASSTGPTIQVVVQPQTGGLTDAQMQEMAQRLAGPVTAALRDQGLQV